MPDREGPTLIEPEPYYTCRWCEHFQPAAYWEHGELPLCKCANREITNHSLCNNWLTPAWCPLLPKSGPLPEEK